MDSIKNQNCFYKKSICYAAQYAVSLLNRGCVIAVPTDTVYGLACLVQNKQAVKRLFAIKQRDPNKPIAICIGSVQELPKYCKIDVKVRPLLDHLLPGPVTLLFEVLPPFHKELIPNTHLIGVRMPNNPFMIHVARLCNGAIALTSANTSNEPSCLDVQEFKQLWPDLDAVFDGGTLGATDPMRLGSTIVDLSVEGSFRIIRNGCALDDVKKILHASGQWGQQPYIHPSKF
ncbi:MAG: L-threonylcarbamoyladenylate synthase [Candidatus Cardinium sp.]|uniref:L-threonylcarbamoyladenylate synthase n=1 Tax=Cardinium endosymbiont of Dermatophagoides farinae TaxID=2597823 RepID=UPI0011828A57|nr:L-threonylcarbamoyladenylate synthase [Cardinium endosymbiont of Dermatophagoides farinae]TSJ81282.1 threonylcarbamoyl-AMP synthase [Cardinium endosymbiont of Dermatophagoides farinae]UWW97341.1 MAG: L-threonylcarbamoyladenylate synthase [Candidatus Cardinium sp.]